MRSNFSLPGRALTGSFLAVSLVSMLGLSLGLAGCGSDSPRAFKIAVAEDGVYRIDFETLAAAAEAEGATLGATDSATLGLTWSGEPVPLEVEDGGDGRFGPGDTLRFLGQRPKGEDSWYHPYLDTTVYRLRLDAPLADAARLQRGTVSQEQDRALGAPLRLTTREHLEHDKVMLRFARTRTGEQPPSWYWARVRYATSFQVKGIDFSTFDASVGEPLRLRLGLRGWSKPNPRQRSAEEPDHVAELVFAGRSVGTASWSAQDAHEMVVEIPAHRVPQRAGLRLKIPKRIGDDGNPIVDVVAVDWIEIEYPRRAVFGEGTVPVDLASPAAEDEEEPVLAPLTPSIEIAGAPAPADTHLRLYDGETVWTLASGETFRPRRTGTHWAVVGPGLEPAGVTVDHPSDLRSPERRADYVMIVHPTLRETLEPLVRHHEDRGRSVEVVEVDDIYDEFHHGFEHPQAIRGFLTHARETWSPPPRWVLLVGDASWDTDPAADDANYADWTYRPSERHGLVKNRSVAYSKRSPLGHRNLIPTWDLQTAQGHAASDNHFVAADDEMGTPQLAIGRLPVVEPEELRGVIEKIIRYGEQTAASARTAGAAPGEPDLDDWRRRTLWITNDHPAFQRRSERQEEKVAELGLEIQEIYPQRSDADNAEHQASIRDAFDTGQLLVHFYGHGGRYIWQTGPPDPRKNHDLFTLDDLDELAPTDQLPVVLSMSCYSAPFDHPTADSIGEKFLRLPDRGAIAVFAASWRNSPSLSFSSHVISELIVPGATLGEAILSAKQASRNQAMISMYNLLGDPALELPVPADIVASAAEARRAAAAEAERMAAIDATERADDAPADGGRARATPQTADRRAPSAPGETR